MSPYEVGLCDNHWPPTDAVVGTIWICPNCHRFQELYGEGWGPAGYERDEDGVYHPIQWP